MLILMNTDDNGILYINGWGIEPEETSSVPRFYKCKMNWDLDKAQEIAIESEELCGALAALGGYFDENDLDIYTEPDFSYLFDEEEAESLLEVWKLFCGGYDHDTISFRELESLAEQRLGSKVNAYNTLIRAKRILRVTKLGALDFIVHGETYEFARALALTRACEKLTFVDITKDEYNSETHMIGEFDENDIRCVFELIRNDCTIMPDVEMAYTLLLNRVFGRRRLDICRNVKEFKPTVDELLGTLSKTETEVLKSLYGLNDGVRKNYGQTALETHIPLPMIIDYEVRAIGKLRHPARSRKLEYVFSVKNEESIDAAELEAFKADVEMAKYMDRVEKGELTEEELENRNAMLNFINSPCDLPDELFEKRK